jgi:hypothetical protein
MASQRETGGVCDYGALEEDGPVTWEALAVLGGKPGAGDPVNKAPAVCPLMDARALGAVTTERHTERASSPRSARQGKTGGVEGNRPARSEGFRWPHMSDEGGERNGTRTQRSKGGPVLIESFAEET